MKSETRTPARVPDTPRRAKSSRNRRCGFNILIVPSPSAPLMIPSSTSGSTDPAPELSFSTRLAGIAKRSSMRSTTNPTSAPRSMTTTRVFSFSGASGSSNRRRVAMTGSTTPRRLARPRRLLGPSGMWARFGSRMISLISSSRKANKSSASRNATRCSSVAVRPSDAAMLAVSTRGASGFGMACRLRLAIAALDVLGERRNFLDRRREFIRAARLLLGRCRCLRCRTSRFLGDGGNLLCATRRLFQR